MPIPSPSSEDSKSLLKKTRSGRHVLPPLAWWRNQNRKCDIDGNIIEITEGSPEFTPMSNLYSTPPIKIQISPIKPSIKISKPLQEITNIQQSPPKKRKLFQISGPKMKPKCFFNNLPNEVVLYVFGFLGPEELCAISPVCKRWNQFAGDDLLWKNLYFRNIDNFIIIDDNVSQDDFPTQSTHNWYKQCFFQKKQYEELQKEQRILSYIPSSHLLHIEAVPTILPSPIKIKSPIRVEQKKERKRKQRNLFNEVPKTPENENAKEFLRKKRIYFEMLDQHCNLFTV